MFGVLVDILQYALTLEHLEATFYAEGMKNYTKQDFVNAGLNEAAYSNLKMIAGDEKSHVQFLTKALTCMCYSTCRFTPEQHANSLFF